LSLSWESTEWSSCTKSCGSGTRKREVGCWRQILNGPKEKVGAKFCLTAPKPKSRERCNTEKCWGKWEHSKWDQHCNNGCGNGYRHRQIYCIKNGHQTNNSNCNPKLKPTGKKPCYSHHKCENEWYYTGNWSECSVTCGHGIQTRTVFCYNIEKSKVLPDSKCDLSQKLKQSRKPCNVKKLCPPDWVTGNWSKCSNTCGEGEQSRTVKCMQNGSETPSQCDKTFRPFNVQYCRNPPPCPLPDQCEDQEPIICHSVRHYNQDYELCKYKRQKTKCCKTCHELTRG
jgi:thrombospondin motif-containing protein 9